MAKRFDPDFIERKQLEVSGQVEHKLTITVDLAELSPEKMAAYRVLVGLDEGSGVLSLITGTAPPALAEPAVIDAESTEDVP